MPATEAADRLAHAAATGTPCAPVRDVIATPAEAYAAQEVNTERRLAAGARLVGRKIGLTSAAVQRQLGVDQPDYGMLFADMAVGEGADEPSAGCSSRSWRRIEPVGTAQFSVR